MKANQFFANKYIRYGLILAIGIFAGWLMFHNPHSEGDGHDHSQEEGQNEVWTCSMHPHIRMDEPGKCPICAMDLIPVGSGGPSDDVMAVHLTAEAAQLANVHTTVVAKQKAAKEIRLFGKVQVDERRLQNQVAHVAGRIDQLMVNTTGERIAKGQTLARIYSPELITTQQELIETIKTKQAFPEIYEATKNKLRQWMLTDSQIEAIEKSGIIQNSIEVKSNTSGIVMTRNVNQGDFVSQGTTLFEIADLSTVWVLFDAYENDLAYIKKGDKLQFTLQALPGKKLSGSVSFIEQVIDPITRVAKIRVEMPNREGVIKPEMFATGMVDVNLAEFDNQIIIPRSAVLWTGKRSVVYVKRPNQPEPIFTMREIDLGPSLANGYVVTNGLEEGEEVVTQGAFSIDAAAQLEGKPSMMSLEGTDDEQSASITVSFTVHGLCGMCKERIETAAKTIKGVRNASWDSETQLLKLTATETTDIDAIHKAIAKVGHDTDRYTATQKAYDELHTCCKYRD
jgi:Cu(I)/Ag(I) efflux system membrane fusion protein